MSDGFTYTLCGACLTPYEYREARCPSCAAVVPIDVVDGYIRTFPAESMPCAGCGSNEEPVNFRGWSQLRSLIWWTGETRLAAYVCADCGRRESAKALAYTALLGWWSIPSWFWYGW